MKTNSFLILQYVITTYMTSAMSSVAHSKRVTEQEHAKKVEYHNSDVGNVCNSL